MFTTDFALVLVLMNFCRRCILPPSFHILLLCYRGSLDLAFAQVSMLAFTIIKKLS